MYNLQTSNVALGLVGKYTMDDGAVMKVRWHWEKVGGKERGKKGGSMGVQVKELAIIAYYRFFSG